MSYVARAFGSLLRGTVLTAAVVIGSGAVATASARDQQPTVTRMAQASDTDSRLRAEQLSRDAGDAADSFFETGEVSEGDPEQRQRRITGTPIDPVLDWFLQARDNYRADIVPRLAQSETGAAPDSGPREPIPRRPRTFNDVVGDAQNWLSQAVRDYRGKIVPRLLGGVRQTEQPVSEQVSAERDRGAPQPSEPDNRSAAPAPRQNRQQQLDPRPNDFARQVPPIDSRQQFPKPAPAQPPRRAAPPADRDPQNGPPDARPAPQFPTRSPTTPVLTEQDRREIDDLVKRAERAASQADDIRTEAARMRRAFDKRADVIADAWGIQQEELVALEGLADDIATANGRNLLNDGLARMRANTATFRQSEQDAREIAQSWRATQDRIGEEAETARSAATSARETARDLKRPTRSSARISTLRRALRDVVTRAETARDDARALLDAAPGLEAIPEVIGASPIVAAARRAVDPAQQEPETDPGTGDLRTPVAPLPSRRPPEIVAQPRPQRPIPPERAIAPARRAPIPERAPERAPLPERVITVPRQQQPGRMIPRPDQAPRFDTNGRIGPIARNDRRGSAAGPDEGGDRDGQQVVTRLPPPPVASGRASLRTAPGGQNRSASRSPKSSARRPSKRRSHRCTKRRRRQRVVYRVRKGDTLWTLSKQYYGKGTRFRRIVRANRRRLKAPSRIYPGQKLVLPRRR